MTAAQLLQIITQTPFVLIFILTAYHAVRSRRRTNMNIALLFGAISVIIVQGWTLDALDRELPYPADKLAPILLMAFPHLLLRLVDDFSGVRTWLKSASLVLVALSALVLLLFDPLPGLATAALVAYFVAVQVYVAFRFVRQAKTSSGVTRRRMQAAAAGSGLLGLALGFVLVRFVADDVATAGSQLAALLSAISYFIAFAPPGVLKRAWQEPELRSFLADAAQLPRLPDTESIVLALEAGAARAVGAPAAVLALWDEERGGVVPPTYADHPLARPVLPDDRSPIAIAYYEQRACGFDDALAADPDNADTYRALGATAILAAPVTAGDRRLGALAVFAPRAPLFDEDDLNLVSLLADHAAVILESRHLIDEAARVRAREEATALKDDFLSAVAHDLKTPLTTLIAEAQLLRRRAQRHPSDPPDLESLETLVTESDRLRRLVTGLLEVARGELAIPVEQSPVDLVEVARGVAASLRAPLHPIRVQGDGFVASYCDRGRITQVLENLVGNAVKYSPQGSPIRIEVRKLDDEARLSVADEGIGISTADLPYIFDRFQRGRHLDDRRFPGMGLGLFICRRIIDQHGGRIWVESMSGKGSTFHVALPAAVTKGTP